MFGRSFRAETRSRAKEELKRVANAIDKVRTWEKKWVAINNTTMKVFKWVPATNQEKKITKKQPVIDLCRPESALSTEDSNNDQAKEPIRSLPKHMLNYMNDDTSQDSVGSDANADSLNDEASRDSLNYTPNSSFSGMNNEDSNTRMHFPGLHEDTYDAGNVKRSHDDELGEPLSKKLKQEPGDQNTA